MPDSYYDPPEYPDACEDCDCSDPTCDPGVADECTCDCHLTDEDIAEIRAERQYERDLDERLNDHRDREDY